MGPFLLEISMPRGVKKVNPEEMTDEQIAEFNAQEAERMEKRKQAQDGNRAKRTAVEPRDESIIRGINGPDRIRVIAKRKIGLDDPEICTCDIDEEIDIPRQIAERLQDNGVIKVKL